ncbi:MAG TPA: pitrilysin family protein [Terriglobales bacterium]|nr:pitrilysin family protein [Terriglobales bacterium]
MKIARSLIAFLFLAATFTYAQKEHALPKELPPYGPLAPVRAPEVKTIQFENGLTVWIVSRSGFPKATVELVVRGGLAADPKDRPGIAEVLANAVTQGTKARTARQIAEQIQAAGGDLSASATRDGIIVSTSVLADEFTQALPVLADVAANASFPDNEVAIAKRNVNDSLRQNEADPTFLANRALAKEIFGDHPYSVVSPTHASIEQTTPTELRQEFARRFQPRQALLIVVGPLSASEAEGAVRKAFESWKAGQGSAVPETPKPEMKFVHSVFLVPRPGSVQTTLGLGFSGPRRRDPDYEAAQTANAVFGGMFGSRLTLNIREDKGYTYSPGSALRTYRQAGFFSTQADVRNAVTGASFNEMTYELNRMATVAPTETEMTQARRFLVGLLAIGLQSGAGLANQLTSYWVDGLPPEEIGKHSERLEKASPEEVAAAARKYFSAARATVTAVGEEKVVKQELEPFGLEVKQVE